MLNGQYTEQDEASFSGPRGFKEKGEPDWCWQTISALQTMWLSLETSYDTYIRTWTDAEEFRVWEKIPYDNPYGSKEAMLEALEVGDAKMAQKRMQVQRVAATARKIRDHGGNRRSTDFQVDNDKFEKLKGGTAEEYLAGRIQRDAPEVFEKLLAGEYESVRKAALDAGIVKAGPKTISLGNNVKRVAATLKDNYSREQVQEIVQVLTEEGE